MHTDNPNTHTYNQMVKHKNHYKIKMKGSKILRKKTTLINHTG